MDLTLLRYIVFIVAAIILIWAAFELRSRQIRRKKLDDKALASWVKLDTANAHLSQEEPVQLPEEEKDEQEEQTDESDIHARSQQNGHYIPSKKTL